MGPSKRARRLSPTGLGAGTREIARRIRSEARAADPRVLARTVWSKFGEHELLTYASAISFQVVFAVVPFLLFALGLLGFLSLQEVWQQDIAPEIERRASEPVFELVNDTANQVLGQKQLFWVTLGAAIAVWQISGAVRAVMQALGRIYGAEETRGFLTRIAISLALAAAAAVLLLAAAAAVRSGPLVTDLLGGGTVAALASLAARWAAALALMLVAVGAMVRFAPDCERPLHWVSFGALVVVAGWSAMSVAFWWYVTEIAVYESVFGSLATLIVLLTYLYWSVIVFLTGVQLDALVQDGIADADHASEERGAARMPTLISSG